MDLRLAHTSMCELMMFSAQVVSDVALAIEKCYSFGVAHRDITPSNYGYLDGRGYLYDFSSAAEVNFYTLLPSRYWTQEDHQPLLLGCAMCLM